MRFTLRRSSHLVGVLMKSAGFPPKRGMPNLDSVWSSTTVAVAEVAAAASYRSASRNAATALLAKATKRSRWTGIQLRYQ